MKEVTFSVLNKIQTIISSIGVRCNHIKEINYKLVPYSTVARLLGMKRFPEQFQINRLLRRIELKDVIALKRSFEINIGRYILNELPESVIFGIGLCTNFIFNLFLNTLLVWLSDNSTTNLSFIKYLASFVVQNGFFFKYPFNLSISSSPNLGALPPDGNLSFRPSIPSSAQYSIHS
jgi:hypothetical protein